MKKTTILLSLATLILLAGCTKDNTNTPVSPGKAPEAESLNCFTLCNDTIPDKCLDQIVELEASGINVMTNDSIYNSEFCQAQCAGWTPEVMGCINKAKSCDQIGPEAEYCITNEPESPFVTDPEVKVDKNCATACKNYSDCTKYTEGVGPQDIADAYATCMSECATWNPENISCMAKARVQSPQDCLAVTMCGLNQYGGMVDSIPE